MPKVHRIGDLNDGQGIILGSLQSTVFANGILVAVDHSPVSDHPPDILVHTNVFTANGSSTVLIGGIPVNRLGDPDTCGHIRIDGSPDVNVGG